MPTYKKVGPRTIKIYKVCCCRPEIPHDETNKLKLIERNFEQEKEDTLQESLNPPASIQDFALGPFDSIVKEESEMTKAEKEYIMSYEREILKTKIFINREKGELVMKGNQLSIN